MSDELEEALSAVAAIKPICTQSWEIEEYTDGVGVSRMVDDDLENICMINPVDDEDDLAKAIAALPDLINACKAQHEAIDLLFAMLIVQSPPGKTFYPSKSGKPWEALVAGNAALRKAGAL